MTRLLTLKRLIPGLPAAVLVLSSAIAQESELFDPGYELPRTQWGHPDLQGVWDRRTITPLERPDRFEGRAYLSEPAGMLPQAYNNNHSTNSPVMKATTAC